MPRRRIKLLCALLLLPMLMAASAQGCTPPHPDTGTPPGPENNVPANIFSPRGGIYIEMFDRKVVYVGYGDLASRINSWRALYPHDSFRVIMRVDPSKATDPLLTEQGIETIAINYYRSQHMPLRNAEEGMSKTYRYYDRAMKDAQDYINKNGWEEDASDPLNFENPDDPGADDFSGFDDFPEG